jgi:hypothetical protein
LKVGGRGRRAWGGGLQIASCILNNGGIDRRYRMILQRGRIAAIVGTQPRWTAGQRTILGPGGDMDDQHCPGDTQAHKDDPEQRLRPASQLHCARLTPWRRLTSCAELPINSGPSRSAILIKTSAIIGSNWLPAQRCSSAMISENDNPW